jgi:hypothetical protein
VVAVARFPVRLPLVPQQRPDTGIGFEVEIASVPAASSGRFAAGLSLALLERGDPGAAGAAAGLDADGIGESNQTAAGEASPAEPP